MSDVELAALFINTILVAALTQGAKWLVPVMKESADWLIGPLAVFLGGLTAWIGQKVMIAIGQPIDMSPILGPFSGAIAAAGFKTVRAAKEKVIG